MTLSAAEKAQALETIRRGLDEDLRYGPDVTTNATVSADAMTEAALVSREPGVAAGVDIALLVLDEVLGSGGYRVLDRVQDGDRLQPGQALLRLQANTRGLITAERTLLNLVCHLSGIATATANGTTTTADKRHLFAVAGEHRDFERGTEPVVVTWRGWRLRLAVCFDLRFPVWLRNTLDADGKPAYDALLVVANWPEAREIAWTTLLAARAMENQCYVAGVNRVGTDGFGVGHSGASRIVGPWGDILAEGVQNQESCVTAQWDPVHLAAVRKRFPFLEDQDPFEVLGMPPEATGAPPSSPQ
jgi:predicted amidohydrolase